MDKKQTTRAAALGLAALGVTGIAAAKKLNSMGDKIEKTSIVQNVDSVQTTTLGTSIGSSTTTNVETSYNAGDIKTTKYSTTTLPKINLVDLGITSSEYMNNQANSEKSGGFIESATSAVNESTTTETSVVSKNEDLIYSDCYQLMQDALAFSFGLYKESSFSLSDAITSTYGIQLNNEQRARYDTLMQDTYDAYHKGISLYESGDMDSFKKLCDELINGNKYLNLNDLVFILASNINKQGDYINNPSDYSISDGKITIDGYTVDSLLTRPDYVDRTDVMGLINFYDNPTNDSLRVLNIFQIPYYVSKEAISPSNLTMVNDNTVYSYDIGELDKRFNDIKNYYCSMLDIDNFGVDNFNGDVKGYSLNSNPIIINNSSLATEMAQYQGYLFQYQRSIDSKVGYFDGKLMKDFIAQYDNGNTNINVSEVDFLLGSEEYDNYSLMQDAIGYSFSRFNTKYSSLSDALVSTYGVELTDEQKLRYDTIMQETYDFYRKGISAYQFGNVNEFRKISDEIINGKKYLNADDLIDIISININSQETVINNSRNYSISDGKLVVDGYTVAPMFESSGFAQAKDFTRFISSYNFDDPEGSKIFSIMHVPYFVVKEATSPMSLSIMCNGIFYAYNNIELANKFDEINNYFAEKVGLTNLSCVNVGDEIVYYGYDSDGKRQIIDKNSEYIGDISRYTAMFKPQYEKSIDGRVGYFDAEIMAHYIKDILNKYNNKNK